MNLVQLHFLQYNQKQDSLNWFSPVNLYVLRNNAVAHVLHRHPPYTNVIRYNDDYICTQVCVNG